MSPDVQWEIPQTIDTIDPLIRALQSEVSLRENLVTRREDMGRRPYSNWWRVHCAIQLQRDRAPNKARARQQRNGLPDLSHIMGYELFGCHLPMKANQRVAQNKFEGVLIETLLPTIHKSSVTTFSCSGSTEP
jgi:hypothetical protein